MSVYVIARITLTDPADYAAYAAQTVALVEQMGGKFLIKGGAYVVVEGSDPECRNVLIEFPTRDMALAWYNSPVYQEILPIALRASNRDLIIVDGV
jgi:uncharacterized protein (DUF1330 family)